MPDPHDTKGSSSSQNKNKIRHENTPSGNITPRGKIMVVDDEPDILATFKEGLEGYGYKVDAYDDPEAALTSFKPAAYDLLVIDIRMPKMDGFKLFQQIEKKDPGAKVCFVTAFENYLDSFREIFPELDIGCFVKKPISISDLAKYVELRLL